VNITLTQPEMVIASVVAGLRQSGAAGLPEAHGATADEDGIGRHFLGAAGEIAAARALGRYWGGDVGTFKRADIGRDIQIRTRSQHWHDLIIRDDDDPDHVFILVTGQPPHMRVHGWYRPADGLRPDWRKPHGGRPEAWFVPQSALSRCKWWGEE